MTTSNILILSAGRRVELVNAFLNEVKYRNLASKVLTADAKPHLSAACKKADASFELPRVSDPSYIDSLLKTCLKNSIDLVIPTIDTELQILTNNKQMFLDQGINIVISDSPLIQACRDKRLTSLLFESLSIDTPKIYSLSNMQFPCFAKPYDGSCSIGALKINGPEDLTPAMRQDSKLMFMAFVDECHTEFTVDAYFDKTGSLSCLVPRERIEVRGGEVSKGITRQHAVYDYLLPKLKNLKGAQGCITLQLFANIAENSYAAIEINPRFGGGFPLTYEAGANYPRWLIDEYLLNKQISFFDDWENNLLMLRYDAHILVHQA